MFERKRRLGVVRCSRMAGSGKCINEFSNDLEALNARCFIHLLAVREK